MIRHICKGAAQAAKVLASQTGLVRVKLLLEMATALRTKADDILQQNELDIHSAQIMGLSEAMIDRLKLNRSRIEAMATGLEKVAQLPESVGAIREVETRPNGLKISKMKVPLGVICMIYEARPNVTADAAALCIKSGNGVILRGGKEAIHSSVAIADVLKGVLRENNLPEQIITLISDTDRERVNELLVQREFIDLVIPRGGEGLINFVSENSQIPVIQHYKGVCHLYIDKHADLTKALRILENGKTQRTGVCNALECLLVHKDIAADFLALARKMFNEKGVKVHACADSLAYVPEAELLDEDCFGEEYLALEIAVRVVQDLSHAIVHIEQFGSHHTEVICTEDASSASYFQHRVDASVVMVNASSRFSDGSELGLGAEIGIATTKLHAYGPMGIESLTAEKFLVEGDGQVRS